MYGDRTYVCVLGELELFHVNEVACIEFIILVLVTS